MPELDLLLATPACRECGQPLPLAPDVCDALALAAAAAPRRPGSASLEVVPPADGVALVRYHPDGGGLRAPYTFVCTVVREGDRGHILGAVGTYDARVRRAISGALHAWGVAVVTWERRNNRSRRKTARTAPCSDS